MNNNLMKRTTAIIIVLAFVAGSMATMIDSSRFSRNSDLNARSGVRDDSEPNNNMSTAQTLTIPGAYTGFTLTAGTDETDWFMIHVLAGWQVNITMDWGTTDDIDFYLNYNGTNISSMGSTTSNPEYINFSSLMTADFYIVVDDFDAVDLAYNLTFSIIYPANDDVSVTSINAPPASTIPANPLNVNATILNKGNATTSNVVVNASIYQLPTPALSEGFESAVVPPAGWTAQNVAGTAVWSTSTTFHSGARSASISYSATGTTGDDWLISPSVAITSGMTLKFWLRSSTGTDPAKFFVNYSAVDGTVASLSANPSLVSLADTNSTIPGIWTQYTVDLSTFVGQTLWFGFNYWNVWAYTLYLDDITIGSSASTLVWSEEQTISGILPGESQSVQFGSFTPVDGATYDLIVNASYPTDVNNTTNVKQISFMTQNIIDAAVTTVIFPATAATVPVADVIVNATFKSLGNIGTPSFTAYATIYNMTNVSIGQTTITVPAMAFGTQMNLTFPAINIAVSGSYFVIVNFTLTDSNSINNRFNRSFTASNVTYLDVVINQPVFNSIHGQGPIAVIAAIHSGTTSNSFNSTNVEARCVILNSTGVEMSNESIAVPAILPGGYYNITFTAVSLTVEETYYALVTLLNFSDSTTTNNKDNNTFIIRTVIDAMVGMISPSGEILAGSTPVVAFIGNNGTVNATVDVNATVTDIIFTNLKMAQGFDSLNGWTINAVAPSFTWEIGDDSNIVNSVYTESKGNVAYIDSDGFGSGHTQNDRLVSPAMDLTGMTNATLTFSHFFRSWTGSSGAVEISINGVNWTTLANFTTTTTTWTEKMYDISAYVGNATVYVAFHYVGAYAYYWLVDDVMVFESMAPVAVYNNTQTGQVIPAAGLNVTFGSFDFLLNHFYDITVNITTVDADVTNNVMSEKVAAVPAPPANNPPVLTTGAVTPTSGNSSQVYNFTVTVTDADADPLLAMVVINGVNYTMAQGASNVFFCATTLAEGSYTFNFSAYDGMNMTSLVGSTLVVSDVVVPVHTYINVSLMSNTTTVMVGGAVNFGGYVLYEDGTPVPTGTLVTINGTTTATVANGSFMIALSFIVNTTVNASATVSTFTNTSAPISIVVESIVVPPVNTAPVLGTGSVAPTTGNTTTSFVFNVSATDVDAADTLTIRVNVDGVAHAVPYTTTLAEGTHGYNFSVSDGTVTVYSANASVVVTAVVVPPVNTPPVLGTGSVTPTTGNTTVSFVFNTSATDVDTADTLVISVNIDGVAHVVPYTTTLTAATHDYNFSVSDGTVTVYSANATVVVTAVVVPPTNSPATLTNASVTPTTGNTDTQFTYSVIYKDADNDAPAAGVVIVIDGVNYTMTGVGTTYTTGVNFTYSTKLKEGTHTVSFIASDGKMTTPLNQSFTLTPKVEATGGGGDSPGFTVFFAVFAIMAVLAVAIVIRRKQN